MGTGFTAATSSAPTAPPRPCMAPPIAAVCAGSLTAAKPNAPTTSAPSSPRPWMRRTISCALSSYAQTICAVRLSARTTSALTARLWWKMLMTLCALTSNAVPSCAAKSVSLPFSQPFLFAAASDLVQTLRAFPVDAPSHAIVGVQL